MGHRARTRVDHGLGVGGGIGLGVAVNRKWLVLPVVSLGLLVWHAVQGRSPAVPLFRRMGLRTRQELDREIYALKVLRGDFKKAHNKGERPRAQRVLEAIAEGSEGSSAAAS